MATATKKLEINMLKANIKIKTKKKKILKSEEHKKL